MIHRDIATLNQLDKEIVYIDEITGDTLTGIVMKIEHIAPNIAFVYVASPYDAENKHKEGNLTYRDIIVFDAFGNESNGIIKDTVLGNYGKAVGIDN